ncbi:protein kinase, putative [Plasmodium gallinaceum]|uniref:Protein kinase, putative n=1 Tax=Plasmodium gallinaceum TaxID=5849 RepID=A0A1J1GPA5_PLAGA|nr:protein kinase, putative [Plasmodium gallinaceum]CRG94245.1 protein kinase, putative [Plasmodium gallinaceum]
MGLCYPTKEKNTKYFHQGYILERRINKNDDSELYFAIFVKGNKERMVRKVNKNILKGITFDYLMKIRDFTYSNTLAIPNYLLKIYNLYEDNNSVYVITEKCTGGFLFDILKNNDCINERLLSEWFYQIITSLCFLEKNNIYHGNLNGYCIFFKDKNRKEIRLSLLSKNNKYDNIDQNGDLYGLFFIRSPQEIKRLYHDKNNTWYVGVLLFFLLFGSYPFISRNILKNYFKIVKNDIPFSTLKIRHNLSKNIYDFLEKALEKNYGKRPSLTELLNHPWITERNNHSEDNIINSITRKSANNQICVLEKDILKSVC